MKQPHSPIALKKTIDKTTFAIALTVAIVVIVVAIKAGLDIRERRSRVGISCVVEGIRYKSGERVPCKCNSCTCIDGSLFFTPLMACPTEPEPPPPWLKKRPSINGRAARVHAGLGRRLASEPRR